MCSLHNFHYEIKILQKNLKKKQNYWLIILHYIFVMSELFPRKPLEASQQNE